MIAICVHYDDIYTVHLAPPKAEVMGGWGGIIYFLFVVLFSNTTSPNSPDFHAPNFNISLSVFHPPILFSLPNVYLFFLFLLLSFSRIIPGLET